MILYKDCPQNIRVRESQDRTLPRDKNYHDRLLILLRSEIVKIIHWFKKSIFFFIFSVSLIRHNERMSGLK